MTHLATATFQPSLLGAFRKKRHVSSSYLQFMISRDLLEKHHIGYPSHLRASEDFYLYAECLVKGGKAGIISEDLYVVTEREGAASGKKSPLSRTPSATRLTISQSAQGLLDKFGVALSATQRGYLETRGKKGLARNTLALAYNLSLDGHRLEAMRMIALAPRTWVFLVEKALGFIARKLHFTGR